jgi:hypothetical protein
MEHKHLEICQPHKTFGIEYAPLFEGNMIGLFQTYPVGLCGELAL